VREELDQRLLGGVLGVGRCGEEAGGEAAGERPERCEERLEGGAVAVGEPDQQVVEPLPLVWRE